MSRQLERVHLDRRALQRHQRADERHVVADITTRLIGIVSLVGMILTLAGGPFEVFLASFFIASFFRLLLVRSPVRMVRRMREHRRGPSSPETRRLPTRTAHLNGEREENRGRGENGALGGRRRR